MIIWRVFQYVVGVVLYVLVRKKVFQVGNLYVFEVKYELSWKLISEGVVEQSLYDYGFIKVKCWFVMCVVILLIYDYIVIICCEVLIKNFNYYRFNKVFELIVDVFLKFIMFLLSVFCNVVVVWFVNFLILIVLFVF